MFTELEKINRRPRLFEFYTASDLWTDEYTSEQMLRFHLDGDIDVSSRKTSFIDRSVEWIISRFKIGPGFKIIDFGCGPGLYTTGLAHSGAEVTGVDFSERSVQYAQRVSQEQGLKINYCNANYLDYETYDQFDLVLMIMCDLCALDSEQRKCMLEKFYHILKPSGAVLLDVYSVSAFEEREEGVVFQPNLLDGFWSRNFYYGFCNTFKYQQEKVILDKYTIIEEHRTRTIFNWLQCFSPEMLGREFESCGLSISEMYSDVAGSSYDPEGKEFAVVAKRK